MLKKALLSQEGSLNLQSHLSQKICQEAIMLAYLSKCKLMRRIVSLQIDWKQSREWRNLRKSKLSRIQEWKRTRKRRRKKRCSHPWQKSKKQCCQIRTVHLDQQFKRRISRHKNRKFRGLKRLTLRNWNKLSKRIKRSKQTRLALKYRKVKWDHHQRRLMKHSWKIVSINSKSSWWSLIIRWWDRRPKVGRLNRTQRIRRLLELSSRNKNSKLSASRRNVSWKKTKTAKKKC